MPARRSRAPVRAASGGDRLVRLRSWVATWGREAVPFAALAVVGLVPAARRPRREADAPRRERARVVRAGGCSSGHGYAYDPVFHGPVQFYLIALADLLIGAGDYVARLPVARRWARSRSSCPFFLRRQLGAVATLTASVALCLSPELPLLLALRARGHPRRDASTSRFWSSSSASSTQPRRLAAARRCSRLLAVAFATKETTYITVFLARPLPRGTGARAGPAGATPEPTVPRRRR